MSEVRNSTYFKDEDQSKEIRGYSGDTEITSEVYTGKGDILFRSGIIPDGMVKEYYGPGMVKRTTHFKDNRPHGKRTDYYPGGEVREESSFVEGTLHGTSRMYRRDGTLWVEAMYQGGKLHGVFTGYHDNGNVEIRAEYVDGRLEGSYVRYGRYGDVMEEATFREGKKHGDCRSYYETGQLARLERCSWGQVVDCEERDEDGRLVPNTRAATEGSGEETS